MTNQKAIPRVEFEQHVYDCLLHLYDYAFLQDHLLVHLLVADEVGANRVQVFRQVVTEAIERLKPEIDMVNDSRAARSYNILALRYVDQEQTQDVIDQLGISERQFYRDHPKAIHAISQILWERAVPPEVTPALAPAISVQSEVQWVHSQAEESQLDLDDLLRGVISTAQSLATEHQVSIDLMQSSELSLLVASRTVLRQAVITVLSQLIVKSAQGSRLTLACEVVDNQQRIVFALHHPAAAGLEFRLDQQESLQYLLENLEGHLDYKQVSPVLFTVTLQMPLNQRTMLVVDDNPGMIDLCKRYLVGQPYHILAAHEAKQAIQLARKSQPAIIILDVMLPGQDGWEVLQNLKNHPTTRHIPVLICSVLDALEWARSLGADGYLRKPLAQADLLSALALWLD